MDFNRAQRFQKYSAYCTNNNLLFSHFYYDWVRDTTFSLNMNNNFINFKTNYFFFKHLCNTCCLTIDPNKNKYITLFDDYGVIGLDVINWRYIFFRKKLLVENYNFITPISKNYSHSVVFMNHVRPYERCEDFINTIPSLLVNKNFNKYILLSYIWEQIDQDLYLNALRYNNFKLIQFNWLYFLWKNKYFFPLKSQPMFIWPIAFKWYLLRMDYEVNLLLDTVNIERGSDNWIFDQVLKLLFKYFYYPYFGWWFDKYFRPFFKDFHYYYFTWILDIVSVYKLFYLKQINYNLKDNKDPFFTYILRNAVVTWLSLFTETSGYLYIIYNKTWRFWSEGYFALSFIFYHCWFWFIKDYVIKKISLFSTEVKTYLFYFWTPAYVMYQMLEIFFFQFYIYSQDFYKFIKTHPVVFNCLIFFYNQGRNFILLWYYFHKYFSKEFYVFWCYIIPKSMEIKTKIFVFLIFFFKINNNLFNSFFFFYYNLEQFYNILIKKTKLIFYNYFIINYVLSILNNYVYFITFIKLLALKTTLFCLPKVKVYNFYCTLVSMGFCFIIYPDFLHIAINFVFTPIDYISYPLEILTYFFWLEYFNIWQFYPIDFIGGFNSVTLVDTHDILPRIDEFNSKINSIFYNYSYSSIFTVVGLICVSLLVFNNVDVFI